LRFFPSFRLARDDERLELASSLTADADELREDVDENFLFKEPGTLVYLTGENICLQEESLFNNDDEKSIDSNKNLD
jgi:hypothetical protein